MTRRRQRVMRSAKREIHDDFATRFLRDVDELDRRWDEDRGGDTPADWARTWGVKTEEKR